MRDFFTKTLPVCLLGLLAGTLNGLLGAGGGIVIVMGLRALLKKERHEPRSVYASAIAVMLPLSVISVWRYAQMGHVDVRHAKGLLLPALIGGAIGALVLRRLTPRFLSRLFSVLVILSGLMLVV
jgi:uncharacterized membrane protein YfcA